MQEVISFIAKMDHTDINELSLDDTALPPDESFDDFYESKDKLTVLSKALAIQVASPASSTGQSSRHTLASLPPQGTSASEE
jgi:hypothetical protein